MSTSPVPHRVRVRMYQVGFGDCVLVTVEYGGPGPDGRAQRHILFDAGSTHPPRNGDMAMKDVAQLVAQHTDGHLDVLVVTHRHKDHLSGFADRESTQTLARLAPDLVLRPWTENPALPDEATAPAPTPVGAASRRFATALGAAQEAAKRLAEQPARGKGATRDLRAAASEQQPNADAVATLAALASGDRGLYLHAGSPLLLDPVIPGMTATVLGPPTIEQYPKVTRQVSRDPEYWMLRLERALRAAVAGRTPAPLFPEAATGSSTARSNRPVPHAEIPPGPVRWLVEHVAGHRTHSLARLVRALDGVLNNTSVILLLEIGGLTMLFPGDAQIEDWRYTLDRLDDDARLRATLARVDLYKVGHHGSRNATPRTLHQLWAERPADAPRMTALMSTCAGVHGATPATAVPRATLVEALQRVAALYSTDDLPRGEEFVEVVAEVSGGPFRAVRG